MNPLVVEILGSFVRAALSGVGGYLVAHGIWTQAQSTKYMEGLVLFIVALLWSVWQKYGMRLKLVTAMGMPAGVSEYHVERAIASDEVQTPPATLQKSEAVRPLLSNPPKD